MIPPDDFGLLEDYLHGQLSPEEAAEVERRLLAEPALARGLILLTREEAILTRWAHATGFVERASGSGGREGKPAPRRPRRAALLVVAACLAVCIGAALWWLGRPPAPPANGPAPRAEAPAVLARVEEMQGEVFVVEDSRRSPARAGQGLQPGQWLQTVGEGSFAVLRFADQTRLELGTGTLIHLLTGPPGGADDRPAPAGKQVFLAEGRVAAESPPAGEDDPMIVTTPHAEVHSLGAHFVSTSAAEATRIDLESGTARLLRKSDGRTVQIHPHSYAVAGTRGGPLQTRPLPRRLDNPRATLREGDGPVLALDFHPRGTSVAVGGWKGRITLWDPADPDGKRELDSSLRRVNALAFSPDGTLLAACGPNRTARHASIQFYDPASGRHLGGLDGMREARGLAFHPDGKVLAALGSDPKGRPAVLLWDVAARAERCRLAVADSRPLCVAFAPDGRALATGGPEGRLTLWDGQSGEKKWEVRRGKKPLRAVAFHPTGERLVVGGRDGILTFHETGTGKKVRTLGGPFGEVRSVAYAPDGSRLAAATAGSARLWDVATGKELTTVQGHRYATTCVCFSPDSETLATAGWDRTVRLWDLGGRAHLGRLSFQ